MACRPCGCTGVVEPRSGALVESPGLGMRLPAERHQTVLAEVVADRPLLSGDLWHGAETATLMRGHGIRRICTRA
jgi:uncharacterized protein